MVCEYARKLPGVQKSVILTDKNLHDTGGSHSIVKSFWNERALIQALKDAARGYDNIFYFFADCPFVDVVLTERMYTDHRKYCAEYTFADGYPYGLSPEIFKAEILDSLLNLIGEYDHQPHRTTVFDIIKKDINSFDIETEISPKDLRLLRLTLAADSPRNMLLLGRIISAGGKDADSIMRIVEENGSILRTLPAYCTVQIVDGTVDRCIYDPYVHFYGAVTGKRREMALDKFETLVDKLSRFCDDVTICLSAYGEPALHSQIIDLIDVACKREKIHLIVETSGKGWRDVTTTRFENYPELTWIVFLDAWSERVYRSVRGDGFEEAVKYAENLITRYPDSTYIQAVRMAENEEDLEHFYRNWEKKTDKIIIQKYDSYCGLLPNRCVTDLSPLKRIPCWHLKRDLSVNVDGTVPLCKEDLDRRYGLGNIFFDDLAEIWMKGDSYYRDHIDKRYLDMCKDCDEYYTYNF